MQVNEDAANELMRQVHSLLRGVEHNRPVVNKYRDLELFFARLINLPPSAVYAAYISKAGNTAVRFNQSERARKANLLIALIDPPSEEHPLRTVEALARYCSRRRANARDDDEEFYAIAFVSLANTWQPKAIINAENSSDARVAVLRDIWDIPEYGYEGSFGRPATLRDLNQIQVLFVNTADRTALPEQDLYQQFAVASLTPVPGDNPEFHSSFLLEISQDPGQPPLSIGTTKIVRRGQRGGRTPLQGRFLELPDEYCSLGQDFSFYENLMPLHPSVWRRVLKGLNDVAFNEDVAETFVDDYAFSNSLLGTSKAQRALKDAPRLIRRRAVETSSSGHTFQFYTSVGGSQFDVEFVFDTIPHVPDRINAIIGYNGTGKTRLLAHLAIVASSDPAIRKAVSEFGTISPPGLPFGHVIAVSYSAFDTFPIPPSMDFPESNDNRSLFDLRASQVNYYYCGLRKRNSQIEILHGSPRALKSIDDVHDEFEAALQLSRSREKLSIYLGALEIVANEPSFSRIGLDPYFFETGSDWRSNFASLSTGHKIVLNILIQIVAHIRPGALVLIDEPESHLHPSLLSALIKALNFVLQNSDSYAVIATHSPVVLQEIPRKCVHILSRFDSRTVASDPDIETFGESIGLLTSDVFRLDSSATDYHDVLQKLATDHSIDEIEGFFGGRMSAQARSYILAVQRRR